MVSIYGGSIIMALHGNIFSDASPLLRWQLGRPSSRERYLEALFFATVSK